MAFLRHQASLFVVGEDANNGRNAAHQRAAQHHWPDGDKGVRGIYHSSNSTFSLFSQPNFSSPLSKSQ